MDSAPFEGGAMNSDPSVATNWQYYVTTTTIYAVHDPPFCFGGFATTTFASYSQLLIIKHI